MTFKESPFFRLQSFTVAVDFNRSLPDVVKSIYVWHTNR